MARLTKILVLLGFAAALVPAAAWAKDHGVKGRGHAIHDRDHDRVRRNHRDRDFDRDDRPPGWDRGRKVGWRNCDVPPGQAKKVGCALIVRHHHIARRRRHDGDHDRDDRRFRRRGDGDHDADDRR